MSDAEVVDRGDDLPVEEVAQATPAPEPELPEAEVPAAETKEDIPRGEDGKFIPKGVFDNRLRSEREAREAAERRAQELEAMLGQASKAQDVAKLEDELAHLDKLHTKLLFDGEQEKAAAVFRDIRMKERQVAAQQTAYMASQAKEQAREEIRMDLTIERLEEAFPVLKPGSDAYDQGLVDDVIGWQKMYIQRDRMPPSMALTRAVEKVMSSRAAPPPSGLSAAQTNTRATEQVARNVATAKAQPPSMKEVGLDSDRTGVTGLPDISKLSADEYAALPETTKAKLRGDFV